MGLRIGRDPCVAVTTTPRAVPLMQRLVDGEASGGTVVSRESAFDNCFRNNQNLLAKHQGL